MRAKEIALIGAPVGVGAGAAGCIMGPAALRTVGIAGTLEALGHKVIDRGDVSVKVAGAAPANARNFPEISAFAQAISAETFDALQRGQFPIVLGGDHSLAMGSVN